MKVMWVKGFVKRCRVVGYFRTSKKYKFVVYYNSQLRIGNSVLSRKQIPGLRIKIEWLERIQGLSITMSFQNENLETVY
jgi:hypothetical protein